MAITYRYVDWPGGAFNVDLGTSTVRLGSISGLIEMAALGAAGNSDLALDDPNATLGNASDAIVGHKLLFVEDDAVPVGNRIVYAGLIGARTYQSADSLITASARRITPTIMDLNALLNLREIQGSDAVRPAETAGARLTWLLSTAFVSGVTDQGYVVYPTHRLDKADLTGMRALDVLGQIVLPVNWNFFVYWTDETATAPGLFLDNSNRSSAYASVLRLSNALADVDSLPTGMGPTGTFAVNKVPVLTRDPERVYSGVRVPWARGTYYGTRASTATAFIARDGSAPDVSIKTAKNAQRQAEKFLDLASTEDDKIDCEVDVDRAHVNSIRAGHLISAKFRNLPGYGSFSYFRVLQRTVKQTELTSDRYTLGLRLSPATPFTCIGLPDVNQLHGTVTGSVAAEAGGVTWAHATISGWFGGPVDTAVSTVPVYNPTYANDGNTATYSECGPQMFRGSGSVAVYWTSTLDATYTVCSVKGTIAVGSSQWRSYPPTTVDYWDGSAWQVGLGSVTYGPNTPVRYWTFTFVTPLNTTKIRLRYAFAGVGGIAGLWGWNALGTRVYDFQIIGAAV